MNFGSPLVGGGDTWSTLFFLKNQCFRHVLGVENDFQQRELVLKVEKRVLEEKNELFL